MDPRSRPSLHIGVLVRLLATADVEWVMSGSTVLALYGADLTPNDLDVVPALNEANLQRLATMLDEVAAAPAFVAAWAVGPSLEQCRAWTPHPATADNLDHLFVTLMGLIDVVPELTGTYAGLRPAASEVTIAGVRVRVCDPTEVLRRIPAKPRPKDIARAGAYEQVRNAIAADREPVVPTHWRL